MNANMHTIISDIADNLGVECLKLSENWVISLRKDSECHYIVGFKFDLNSQATGALCDDKYALYTVLEENNIPVASHHILFNDNVMMGYKNIKSTKDLALDYFKSHHEDVVLKANIGSCGNQVYHVTDVINLENKLEKLFTSNNTISTCPFYHIKHEYRIIYLNGECKLIYGKIKPTITGDGKTKLIDLFRLFNPHYFNDSNILPCPNYSWDYIPSNGQEIEYSWKFNLSKGATAFITVDGLLKEKLISLASKAAELINLRFGSIDIIECDNNDLMILEINSGVMMENIGYLIPNGKEIVYSIYESAIKLMFHK